MGRRLKILFLMRKTVLVLCLLTIAFCSYGQEIPRYSVDRMSVSGRGGSLAVVIDWSFTGNVGDNSALVMKPSIKGKLGEASLSPVVVYGKKAFYGKQVASGDDRENAYLLEGGRVSFRCEDVFPYEQWMDTVRFTLAVYDWTKRTGLFLLASSSKWTYAKPGKPEEPELPWEMLSPVPDMPDTPRTVSFEAPVVFDGKSAKFDIGYGDNLGEIGPFIDKVKSVASSKSFSVKSSSLSVSLPPEANSTSLMKRSSQCAQSLYGYMQRAGAFRSSSPVRKGAGGDWDGIREWVLRSRFADDERISEILSWEGREDAMWEALSREKPVAWEELQSRCFPSLGKAVYTASIKPVTFPKPNFVIPFFEDIPEVLSAYDFYYLSTLYDVCSDDWMNVICTGAELYPESEELNMDAAMGWIRLGNTHAAVPYLRHIGMTDNGKYVYACWLFYSGRYGEALDIFRTLSERNVSYSDVWRAVYPFSKWVTNEVEWNVLRM